MSKRIKQIKNWLTEHYGIIKYFDVASSDASFRGYFRVIFSSCHSSSSRSNLSINTSYIVMDAPPEHEDIKPFIQIATFLEKQAINVPHIYAVNEEDGFLLLGDLGTQNYLDHLNLENADTLYKQAMSVLIKLQAISADKLIKLPDYNSELLNREMDLFDQWYIKVHLKKSLTNSQQQILDKTLIYLTEQILLQPTGFVHRDFHSRNLMFVDKHNPGVINHNPGVIDFQDAVIGPCTYDLVSLFRDSYIAWPDQQVEAWVAYFYQQLVSRDLIAHCGFETFMQWFDFMGMQRQIKVVGIFCRLYHRDAKSNYLNDIPQTLAYLKASSQKYPQFSEFYNLLIELQNS